MAISIILIRMMIILIETMLMILIMMFNNHLLIFLSPSFFSHALSLTLSLSLHSGDDGIANSIIRKNKKLGCSKSWPDWPASSAFVTAVGATQLSNSYASACTSTYDV